MKWKRVLKSFFNTIKKRSIGSQEHSYSIFFLDSQKSKTKDIPKTAKQKSSPDYNRKWVHHFYNFTTTFLICLPHSKIANSILCCTRTTSFYRKILHMVLVVCKFTSYFIDFFCYILSSTFYRTNPKKQYNI